MKIKFLTIGRTINTQMVKLQEEYQQRLKFYIPFENTVIPELKKTKKLSETEQKDKEADLILKQIEANDDVILLDDKGTQFSSIEFAGYIQKKMNSGNKRTVFVVGGPYGFAPRIYQRANGLLSLSTMTFSHQMVRLVFLEQLYRGMTIIKGEPYHHE